MRDQRPLPHVGSAAAIAALTCLTVPTCTLAQDATTDRANSLGDPEWLVIKKFFIRSPIVGDFQAGPSDAGGHDVIQDPEWQGPGRIQHGPGPVQRCPVYNDCRLCLGTDFDIPN